jgi:putative tricarboxylic transport membrane protein
MKLPQGGKSELAFAGSLFILGAIIFWETYRIVPPELNLTVSPKVFPYAVSILLMALTLALVIQILRGEIATPEGAEPGEKIEKTDYKTFTLVLASILSFMLLIERAGFVIAASLTFFGITVAFDNKRHLRSAIGGTIFITIVYFSFTRFLNVQLPAGIFEGLA